MIKAKLTSVKVVFQQKLEISKGVMDELSLIKNFPDHYQ